MKKLILFSLFALIFSGCDFNQDPLHDASPEVQAGQKPDDNVSQAEEPWPEEALILEAPKVVNGVIGRPVEFELRGRVALTESVPFTYHIENLYEFPGATFDVAKGLFRWIPDKSFLIGDQVIVLSARVAMITEPTATNPSAIERQTVSIVISNYFEKPVINVISGTNTMVSGERYYLDFVLEDRDARDENDVNLIPQGCGNSFDKSLAHLVFLSRSSVKKDPAMPGRYTGKIMVDLTGAYGITYSNYCVAMVATTRHGLVSDLYSHGVTVEPMIAATVRSMDSTSSLKVGESAVFHFNIYDETRRSQVSLVSVSGLEKELPGSRLYCFKIAFQAHKLECVAEISTAGALPGTYAYDIQVRSLMPKTNQERIDSHRFRVRVHR